MKGGNIDGDSRKEAGTPCKVCVRKVRQKYPVAN